MSRLDTDDYLQLFLQDTPMIDTRAPIEFSRGAFANAVNMPLMSDEERHLVGTRYKEAGQEAAIALGRQLVDEKLQSQRTEAWVEFARRHPDGYLYCFRGGLRSRITQQWMAQAGVRYPYIKGGYKAMRRFLIERFAQDLQNTPLRLISGRTGTGKTLLLSRIKRSLDLEALANHRGSSFGPMESSQPTPVNFENALAVAMLKLTHNDTKTPVWVEGEGKQVGSLSLPAVLWCRMLESPTIVLEADMDRRVDIGIADYVVDLLARIRRTLPGDAGFRLFAERHRASLWRIRKRFGNDRYQSALALLEKALKDHRESAETESYRPFIRLMLEEYYDPMYDYQLANRNSPVIFAGDEQALIDYLRTENVELF